MALGKLEITDESELSKNDQVLRSVANICHELRSPITSIAGYSRLLLDEVKEKNNLRECEKYVDVINFATDHLMGLAADLMDASALISNKVELEETWFAILPELEEITTSVQMPNSTKRILLQEDRSLEALFLHADKRRFRQIIINLLTNALKYSLESSTVVISCQSNFQGLKISIIDQGEGMTENEVALCLQSFGRAHSQQSKISGVGLGLPIVQCLLRLHGGGMKIESEKGKGTTASIEFPAYRVLDQINEVTRI